MREMHHAAGIDLDQDQAELLVSAITGVVTIALTTPEAIGADSADHVRALVRSAARIAHETGSPEVVRK
jgi:hypothetical protein